MLEHMWSNMSCMHEPPEVETGIRQSGLCASCHSLAHHAAACPEDDERLGELVALMQARLMDR